MITYYFLYICVTILNGLAYPFYSLPNATLPGNFTTWLSLAGGYIATAYHLMPFTIAALLIVVGVMVAFENADGIFKVVKWIYTKIPGIN